MAKKKKSPLGIALRVVAILALLGVVVIVALVVAIWGFTPEITEEQLALPQEMTEIQKHHPLQTDSILKHPDKLPKIYKSYEEYLISRRSGEKDQATIDLYLELARRWKSGMRARL